MSPLSPADEATLEEGAACHNNSDWPSKSPAIVHAAPPIPATTSRPPTISPPVSLPPFLPPPPYHFPVLDQVFPASSTLSRERLHMTNDLSVLRHMVKNRKEQIQLLQAVRDLDQELSKLTHITYIPKPPQQPQGSQTSL